ncbi:MAG: SH3 domain-containing protein [Treponemataceae bacterium]|nr:SH3 domain-containing protein [Treponemataceae bacterium]
MKTVFSRCLFVLVIFLLFCLSSCSKIMGYGVLLWSVPENGLSDGDVVPVYIKSKISGVYVIGLPGTEDKIEVPLWQITEPESSKNAEITSQKYADYKHMYARVVLDGLPMRAEAVNTSKQVYRLRKNEVIKVLYKGKGQAVMSGSTAMAGDWLRVIASDGTTGWCFSYNLRLFDETVQNDGLDNADIEEADSVRDNMLESVWYPEEYKDMEERGMVDLSKMKRTSAFDTGFRSGEIRLTIEDISVKYPYDGVTKTSENVYKFNGTPLTVTVRKSNFIVVQYIGERGMPVSYNLVTLNKPVGEIIDSEITRRADVYENLRSLGPYFISSNYGTLYFDENNTFIWTGYGALTPSVIPYGSGNTGSVSLSYFLSSSLTFSYDGAISLKFDGGKEMIFLYSIEEDGLRIEDATKATIKDNIIRQRASNSNVVYFSFSSELPQL